MSALIASAVLFLAAFALFAWAVWNARRKGGEES